MIEQYDDNDDSKKQNLFMFRIDEKKIYKPYVHNRRKFNQFHQA